jgi:hypothetical protein
MPVILPTPEAGGSWFEASRGTQFERQYLKKTHHKNGLVEWLQVQALDSNTSTEKKEKKLRWTI